MSGHLFLLFLCLLCSWKRLEASVCAPSAGHRYSASVAIARSGRLGAETGSSGEASTAAGDKNACSKLQPPTGLITRASCLRGEHPPV